MHKTKSTILYSDTTEITDRMLLVRNAQQFQFFFLEMLPEFLRLYAIPSEKSPEMYRQTKYGIHLYAASLWQNSQLLEVVIKKKITLPFVITFAGLGIINKLNLRFDSAGDH